jgi:hypothetical protein
MNDNKLVRIFSFVAMGIIIVLVVGVIFGVRQLLDGSRGEKISVPDVVGLPSVEAIERIKGQGLDYQVGPDGYSDSITQGSIYFQEPSPGMMVDPGTTVITIQRSLGPDTNGGSVVVDTDGDGYVNNVDSCPNQGDLGSGVDPSGCPILTPVTSNDQDGDGFIDPSDACPNKGDQGNGVDATGCPNPISNPVSNCTHASRWVSQSIPDGTSMEPGQSFTVTWQIENTGTCIWDSNYQAIYSHGSFGVNVSPVAITSGTVAPGQTANIAVSFTAPSTAGYYESHWQIKAPAGEAFGVTKRDGSGVVPFFLEIQVGSNSSSDTYYPIAGCAASRIHVGDRVGLTAGTSYATVRSYPDTHPSDNRIGRINQGETADVIGGPECNYGWLLWEIRKTTDGLTGWAPETDGVDFWLVRTGAASQPTDWDGDGYNDSVDQCPSQGNQGYGVDSNGCPNSAPDSDGDGYNNAVDQCPNLGDQGYGVDINGCPNSTPDTDGDGYNDAVDNCPNQGDQGDGIDSKGCPNLHTTTIQEIMAGAHLVEYLMTNSATNLNAILSNGNYNARQEGDFVVWERPIYRFSQQGQVIPTLNVTLRFALSSLGELYVGGIGDPQHTLILLIGHNADWWVRQLTVRDVLIFGYLENEYNRLISDGYLSGGSGINGSADIWNYYDDDVKVLYSALMMFEKVNGEWLANDRLDLWDPTGPGESTYQGDTYRTLNLSCSSNTHALIFSHVYNDNGNSTYAKHDDAAVASNGTSIGGDEDIRFNQCPNRIELGGNRSWSIINSTIHVVVVGGSMSSSNPYTYPENGYNSSPSLLTIKPVDGP